MGGTANASPWFVGRRRPGRPSLRLFCLPYAGGGAAIYRQWPAEFPAATEVWAVQLPGREQRFGEPPLTVTTHAAASLATALVPFLEEPFAFFGHSMGAAIAYETARIVAQRHHRAAACLMVSGRRAPHLPARKPPVHGLPDEDFLAELRRLDGTPAGVLEHEELMQLMLPTLRGDFQLAETYQAPGPVALTCPVIAFGGTDDPEVDRSELEAWRQISNGDFRLHMIEGGHFFVNSERGRLIGLVRSELSRWTG